MMKHFNYIIILLFLALITPSEALSQNPDKLILVPDHCKGSGVIKANRMTGNIVRCVDEIVSDKADELIEGMIGDYSFIVFHVIIISIILFFMRVMYGVSRARGVISMYMAKVLLVLYVVSPDNADMIIDTKDAILEFPKEISLNILEAVKSPIDNSGSNNITEDDVFDVLYQYVLKLLGVDESKLSDDKNEPQEIFIGIAALVAGLLFTGSVGAAVSAISVGYVIAIIVAIAEVVLFFCVIIISLNFLAAIAPITVTCILFQATKRITTLWFQYCLIYVIQPILLMAMLGMTLGILDGVVDAIDGHHESVLDKWENTDGTSVKDITLFDCSNMSVSVDSLTNIFSSNNLMGQAMAQSTFADSEFDRYSRGLSGTGGVANLNADQLSLNFGAGCKITAPSIRLDFDRAAFDDPNITSHFDEESLDELMGIKIGVTVLMIMLISFMMAMPKSVSHMVGQGVVSNIAQYASSPVQQARDKLMGTYKDGQLQTPGIVQNITQNMNQTKAKR